MTSPNPLLYDTYYHIYNRGVNRENIFFQERNYTHFLNLYAKYIEPIAETFAYCLLRNHFHLLVRIKSGEEIGLALKKTPNSPIVNAGGERSGKNPQVGLPSKKFSDFFDAYAKAINKAYGRTGSLFQHPFGRVIVRSQSQLWNVIAYIHQNPQKHKFVDDFREWKYSSYGLVLSEKKTFLQRDVVLEWFGGDRQYLDLHDSWVTENQSKWFAEEDDEMK